MSESTDIVHVPATSTELSFDDARKEIMSLDRSTPQGKVDYYNAMLNKSDKLSEHVNVKLLLRDAVIHEIEVVDDDSGELKRRLRVVLIDSDGKTYDCQSAGVWKSLKILCGTVGPLPWKPAREVQIRQTTIKENRRWLEVVFTQEEIARILRPKKT